MLARSFCPNLPHRFHPPFRRPAHPFYQLVNRTVGQAHCIRDLPVCLAGCQPSADFFALGRGSGRECHAELAGQPVKTVYDVLFVDDLYVRMDGGVADAEVGGDLGVGDALEEAL